MNIQVKKYDFDKMTYQEMVEAYHLIEKDLLELRLVGFRERVVNYSFLKKGLKKNRSRLLQRITLFLKSGDILSMLKKMNTEAV